MSIDEKIEGGYKMEGCELGKEIVQLASANRFGGFFAPKDILRELRMQEAVNDLLGDKTGEELIAAKEYVSSLRDHYDFVYSRVRSEKAQANAGENSDICSDALDFLDGFLRKSLDNGQAESLDVDVVQQNGGIHSRRAEFPGTRFRKQHRCALL